MMHLEHGADGADDFHSLDHIAQRDLRPDRIPGLSHQFQDRSLLERALVHPKADPDPARNMGRLAVIGESLLRLGVQLDIVEAAPKITRSALGRAVTAVMKDDSLAAIGVRAGLPGEIVLNSAHPAEFARRTDILAASVAAITAATFLDGGSTVAMDLVRNWCKPAITEATANQGEYPESHLRPSRVANRKVLETVQTIIGYEFKNPLLAEEALAKLRGGDGTGVSVHFIRNHSLGAEVLGLAQLLSRNSTNPGEGAGEFKSFAIQAKGEKTIGTAMTKWQFDKMKPFHPLATDPGHDVPVALIGAVVKDGGIEAAIAVANHLLDGPPVGFNGWKALQRSPKAAPAAVAVEELRHSHTAAADVRTRSEFDGAEVRLRQYMDGTDQRKHFQVLCTRYRPVSGDEVWIAKFQVGRQVCHELRLPLSVPEQSARDQLCHEVFEGLSSGSIHLPPLRRK